MTSTEKVTANRTQAAADRQLPAGLPPELLVHAQRSETLEFDLLDRTWDLLPGVWPPYISPETKGFTDWLPYPVGGSFLEVGSGCGVTSVTAALRGVAQVTALDITQEAVDNTLLNAARHGVAENVRALRSDVFAALGPDERFDVIYWDSNALLAPENFTYTHYMQRAIMDAGYVSHRSFLVDGPRHLTDGGRLFLGFNDSGDWDKLAELEEEAGLIRTELGVLEFVSNGSNANFRLLEYLTKA
ncbi:methyltransferase domain-containing protein [Streptomyces bacillaris]|uniref:Methyltransferase domain-containing protein n=1 Tax=Streptomyces cavourensis TaxID=67258 RepID=A0AAD0Q6A9_9ACTN|nr:MULTISPECIES: methyltransferase domain-containing protein [Streptomyces]NUW23032.1 methyltransferase domain-containing protein [Streptomyces roseoviolaceus]ATY97381.1 SAM-dependent methyltransferase [Streptomyces cavourensis]AXI73213.1 methyltransferase domain-containing protein [Streptomyces cavourensis]MBH0243362.1 methyltransferase domain-containing protein [Streptomyces cavourensis]NUV39672.1 methyltransferase domain-containing protein [Streptomyces sp. CAI-24]